MMLENTPVSLYNVVQTHPSVPQHRSQPVHCSLPKGYGDSLGWPFSGITNFLHDITVVEIEGIPFEKYCSFCYSCCCVPFATRFQINQINSTSCGLFYYFCRRFAHLFSIMLKCMMLNKKPRPVLTKKTPSFVTVKERSKYNNHQG